MTRASRINDARACVRSVVRWRARARRETMARARCGRRRAVAACAACAVLALSASVVDDPRADASASREGARTSVRAAGWGGTRAAWTGFARAASAAASADEGLFDDALFDDDAFDDEDEDEDEEDDGDEDEDGEETVRRMSEEMARDDDDDDDDDDARGGDDDEVMVSRDDGARASASGRDEAVERSTLDDLVQLGGVESRALMRDLFEEANKLGIDFDDDDDDDDEDGGGDDDEGDDVEVSGVGTKDGADAEPSTELHAVEYNAEEDDSEDERAIEQRKKLLLGLGVDIDTEPVPAIVEEETATEEERETEPEVAAREESREEPARESVPEPEQPEPVAEDQNDSVQRKRRTRTLLATFTQSNVRWLTWDDMPGSVQSKVSASVPANADVRIVRVGGYWRAASMNNRRRRKSKSRNGFPLRKYESDEPATECNQRHVMTQIACFGENSKQAVITVEGAHSFFPGDLVTFENINSQNTAHMSALNSQYRVFGLPVDLNTDPNEISQPSWWDNVWDKSPLLDSRKSVFAVSFDAPGIACDAVPMSRAIVRRSTNTRLPFC